jgi:membrane protein implicated in regulation of membrane protease activity
MMESMMDFLAQLTIWHWLILATAMLILEAFAPGAIFLWLGVAAGCTGVLMWLIPMGWQVQLSLFSVLSIASALGWRYYRGKNPSVSDQPTLNRRGHQYVGRVFTLEHAIVNGVGKVRVDDSTWKISGPDLGAGTSVKVVDVDGVVFRVEAVE